MATLSPGFILVAFTTNSPFTVTRACSISLSASLREQKPEELMYLLRLISSLLSGMVVKVVDRFILFDKLTRVTSGCFIFLFSEVVYPHFISLFFGYQCFVTIT